MMIQRETAISELTQKVLRGQDLTVTESHAVVQQMMTDACRDVEIGALLTALCAKGESTAELVGAALAIRECIPPIPSFTLPLLDTCGTGGDGLGTFNISTAVAFVVASMGVPVAKHGNRGVSSKTGSADVLQSLGARVDLSPRATIDCLDELGLGFFYTPRFHAAAQRVKSVRRQLGFPTIFNLLGPLTNPAGATFQLIGASQCTAARKIAAALTRLGCERALVVCGNDELDEVGLYGVTTVYEVSGKECDVRTWTHRDFNLKENGVGPIRVGSAQESAQLIRSVLAGDQGPARDYVLANAGAALIAANRFTIHQPAAAANAAAQALDSGQASILLDRFVQSTKRLAMAE